MFLASLGVYVFFNVLFNYYMVVFRGCDENIAILDLNVGASPRDKCATICDLNLVGLNRSKDG